MPKFGDLFTLLICCASIIEAQITCDENVYIGHGTTNVARSDISKPKIGYSQLCTITLFTDSSDKIKLENWNLEGMPKDINGMCISNYITVGSTLISLSKKYCGNDKAVVTESAGSQLLIRYLATSAGQSRSFQVTVSKVDPRSTCGTFMSQFDGSKQVFKFPLSDQFVKSPAVCTYTILNKNGRKIKAKLLKVNLRESVGCLTDYVTMGSSEIFTSEKFCGQTAPGVTYTTVGDKLYLTVKVTDYSINPNVNIQFESGASKLHWKFCATMLVIIQYLDMVLEIRGTYHP